MDCGFLHHGSLLWFDIHIHSGIILSDRRFRNLVRCGGNGADLHHRLSDHPFIQEKDDGDGDGDDWSTLR